MTVVVEISKRQIEEIASLLRKAGRSEIGGILLGEHLGKDHFRIIAYDVNPKGEPQTAIFIRDEISAKKRCEEFFKEKNEDFSRFNYLGEWHSHPNFSVQPSAEDDSSMWAILESSSNGALFAVLMIVRLGLSGVEVGMWAYFPGRVHEQVECRIVSEYITS